jgi:hypothetical protein
MRDSACWVTGATTTDRNIETKNGPKRTTSWIRHDKPGTHVQTTLVPEGRHKAESGTAVPGCRTKNSRVPKGRHIAYPGVAMPGRNDPEPGTGRLNGTPQNPGHGKTGTHVQNKTSPGGTAQGRARHGSAGLQTEKFPSPEGTAQLLPGMGKPGSDNPEAGTGVPGSGLRGNGKRVTAA